MRDSATRSPAPGQQPGSRHPVLSSFAAAPRQWWAPWLKVKMLRGLPSDTEFGCVRAVLCSPAGRAAPAAAPGDRPGCRCLTDVARGCARQPLHRRARGVRCLCHPAAAGRRQMPAHVSNRHAGDGVVAAGDHMVTNASMASAGGVAVGADPGGYQVGDGVVGGLVRRRSISLV